MEEADLLKERIQAITVKARFLLCVIKTSKGYNITLILYLMKVGASCF